MNKIRAKLKRFPGVQVVVLTYRTIRNKVSLGKKLYFMCVFFSDLRKYKNTKKNSAFTLYKDNLRPMIFEKTTDTVVDPIYFYQDSWCAKKIFENKPSKHIDIASEVGFVGIVSQFVPTTMIDIRPVNLSQPGFTFQKGDITDLPLEDNSVESLSTICVIEHIGLGRFGDTLDPFGSEKSIEELKRVLRSGGNLYISVPIDKESKIYFNAHRTFTREHILDLFSPLELVEEKYIYGRQVIDSYDASVGFGTGLYHFRKK
mgnify:CR=1 FL=1